MKVINDKSDSINDKYTKFYTERRHSKVYPTEFVVRTFLANYPRLKYKKSKPCDAQ